MEGGQFLYFWYAIKVVGSSSFTEKMEPKCTLHGSSASIMSVQFDQLVSVIVCLDMVRRGGGRHSSTAGLWGPWDKYSFLLTLIYNLELRVLLFCSQSWS